MCSGDICRRRSDEVSDINDRRRRCDEISNLDDICRRCCRCRRRRRRCFLRIF